jgi:hypothetical protein
MKLLTKANLKALPEIGSTSPTTNSGQSGEAVAQVKFFTPWSNWTWYATEYDPFDRIFFGLVDGLEKELGYFSLDELESVSGPWGLKIERDRHFEPTALKNL